jgi:hypothetical protein
MSGKMKAGIEMIFLELQLCMESYTTLKNNEFTTEMN